MYIALKLTIVAYISQHLKAVHKGGRPQKKIKGRPSGTTPGEAIAHLRNIAPPSILKMPEDASLLEGSTVNTVVDRPLELECGKLACVDCCCKAIEASGNLTCPCCSTHKLDENSVRVPSSAVMDLLSDLMLKCKKCSLTVPANQFETHRNKNCYLHPTQVCAQDILNRPLEASPLPASGQETNGSQFST